MQDDLSLAEIHYTKLQAQKADLSFARWSIYKDLIASGMHCTDALHEARRRTQ